MKKKIMITFLFLAMFFSSYFGIGYVHAEEPNIVMNIEKPVTMSQSGGDIEVTGYAVSKNVINKIDVYFDNKYIGKVNYGLLRQDVQAAFPSYPNSLNSGFSYKFNSRGYTDGLHEIKLVLQDSNSNTSTAITNIQVKNQRTPIIGQAIVSKAQMIKYLQSNNSAKDYNYAENFVSTLIEESSIEGIRADIAFAQMMKETNFLKFTGQVREEQNNFAGMKTKTGDGYQSFPDIRTGIRAVIQHLKCYASTEPIKQAIVDPRYGEWLRNKAPYAEWLGINENPYGTGWAEDGNYGYDIVNKVNLISTIKVTAKITALNVSSELWINNTTAITVSGTAPTKAWYRYWIVDKSTGKWTMIQDYTQTSTIVWKPTVAGKYDVVVQVKDQASYNSFDDSITKEIVVGQQVAKATGLNVVSELLVNNEASITASGTAPNNIWYRYWIVDKSTGKWTMIQDYTQTSTVIWKPTKTGKYDVIVHVKDQASYNYFDDSITKEIVVNQQTAKATGLNVASELWVNNGTTITASGTAPNNIWYRYWIVDKSTGKWTMIQDYTQTSTITWKPTKIGKYDVVVHVKDQASYNYFDDSVTKEIVVNQQVAKIAELSVASELWENNESVITVSGTAPTNIWYRYFIVDKSTGKWTMIQDYTQTSTVIWKPQKSGRYDIVIHAKDQASYNAWDDSITKEVNVKQRIAKATALSIENEAFVNKETTIAALGTAFTNIWYRYFTVDKSTGTWTMIQDYTQTNSITWKPTKAGRYDIVVHVKDQASYNSWDDAITKEILVKQNRTIVLDAGHNYGGDDGAYSTFGSTTYSERDLNMQMTLKLKAELEKLGYNIILTREESDRSKEDASTSLQKRANLANSVNADLFISLHHDVSSNTNTTGISTHYSTYKPGIDNSGINPNGNDPNGWYSGVNIDTTPSDAAIKSRDLAIKLAAELSGSLGYKNLNAHDHNLFVTVNTNMPAVLIEEGFLSNQAEAQRCADSNQQTIKAQKIAQIINDFFKL